MSSTIVLVAEVYNTGETDISGSEKNKTGISRIWPSYEDDYQLLLRCNVTMRRTALQLSESRDEPEGGICAKEPGLREALERFVDSGLLDLDPKAHINSIMTKFLDSAHDEDAVPSWEAFMEYVRRQSPVTVALFDDDELEEYAMAKFSCRSGRQKESTGYEGIGGHFHTDVLNRLPPLRPSGDAEAGKGTDVAEKTGADGISAAARGVRIAVFIVVAAASAAGLSVRSYRSAEWRLEEASTLDMEFQTHKSESHTENFELGNGKFACQLTMTAMYDAEDKNQVGFCRVLRIALKGKGDYGPEFDKALLVVTDQSDNGMSYELLDDDPDKQDIERFSEQHPEAPALKAAIDKFMSAPGAGSNLKKYVGKFGSLDGILSSLELSPGDPDDSMAAGCAMLAGLRRHLAGEGETVPSYAMGLQGRVELTDRQ